MKFFVMIMFGIALIVVGIIGSVCDLAASLA